MASNRDRQRAFKARMRAEGKRQLTVWVTPTQAAHIKDYLRESPAPPATETIAEKPAEPLPVTPPPPTPAPPAAAPAPSPRPAKPTLRRTEQAGHWLVFLGKEQIGTVTRKEIRGIGGGKLIHWEARRRSMLDALYPMKARTRQEAVRRVLGEDGLEAEKP